MVFAIAREMRKTRHQHFLEIDQKTAFVDPSDLVEEVSSGQHAVCRYIALFQERTVVSAERKSLDLVIRKLLGFLEETQGRPFQEAIVQF
jgi:hypothetical protein